MNFTFSTAEQDFRQEVRRFLRDELPPDVARIQRQGFDVHRADTREWHRRLHSKGWAAHEWPTKYGGTGWNPVQRFLYEDEYAASDAPYLSTAALHLVGPIICEFGSNDLKARYLEKIKSGEIFFAQGFSEPTAGSDLANLRTRAVLDGDEYVINGSKIWTGHAHEADMIFALCRTDPNVKPQAGLSMIVFDLKSPGVRIRPIVTLEYAHHLNEVFFENVRVPKENLIGEENKAWSYAKFLLNNERTFNAHFGRLKRYVRKIREVGDAEAQRGIDPRTPAFRRKVAALEIEVHAQEWSVLRVLCAQGTSPAVLGAAASALKVRGSELLLRATELEMELAGVHAFPIYADPRLSQVPPIQPTRAADYMPGIFNENVYWRASRIFSGTNEIQRGIIWNTLKA
jgi:alkylation response protein AidB-like acyl-CoA dehydrogenase